MAWQQGSDRIRRSPSLDGNTTRKLRITLTLSPSIVQLLDRRAKATRTTRSTAADRLLRDALTDDAGELIDEITDRLKPAMKKRTGRKQPPGTARQKRPR